MIELPFTPRGPLSRERLWLARGIAIAADAIQIAFFPVDVEGIISPVDAVLDAVVAAVLVLLLGFHIALLPSFLIKALPVADLAPTWTIAVFIATRGRIAENQSEPLALPLEPTEPWRPWYDALRKPGWTPAPAAIGRIWSVLYPIIFVVDAFLAIRAIRGRLPWLVLLPFGINLLANFLFTPILFRLKNLWLAAADVLIVLATIIWAMIAIWPWHPLIALAFAPYLAWVCVASTLQLCITSMNPRR